MVGLIVAMMAYYTEELRLPIHHRLISGAPSSGAGAPVARPPQRAVPSRALAYFASQRPRRQWPRQENRSSTAQPSHRHTKGAVVSFLFKIFRNMELDNWPGLFLGSSVLKLTYVWDPVTHQQSIATCLGASLAHSRGCGAIGSEEIGSNAVEIAMAKKQHLVLTLQMLRQKTTNAPIMVRCGKIVWRLLWSVGSYALKIIWVTRKHLLLHHMMRLVHRSQKCIRKITAKKGNLTSNRTWVSSLYLEKNQAGKSSGSIPHQ